MSENLSGNIAAEGLVRFCSPESTEPRWGWLKGSHISMLPDSVVNTVLKEPGSDGLMALSSLESSTRDLTVENATLLPPVVEGMEVWAAGVTYESSKFARMSESEDGGDCYARVYVADRPELFLKATPSRCVGQGDNIRIRYDSFWNVPEPELALFINAVGDILGLTIGNDVSSRDIEGANPLYLPQAKVYIASCSIGPIVVPIQQLDPAALGINLQIWRDGNKVFEGDTSTARMKRNVSELAAWLFRENQFPAGAVLLTGTGIIPAEEFTLEHGDTVVISIEGIGSLTNQVVRGASPVV